jgi:tetratricopeptide (TPR) repeat protein
MLTLLISLACSLVASAVTMRYVTAQSWIVVLVSFVVFFAVFVLISRTMMKRVTAVMTQAQKDVMANRSEKAISDLKAAMKYSSWQFYVKGQINSQIGTIHYIKREFSEAFPYLLKGFTRNWVSTSMLGVSYMKKNNPKKMIATFEKCITANRKESMPYALYAFCLDRIGDRSKAISILNKGIKKAAGDERLKENVALLEAGKRMKMMGFGDMWYQFHLEKQGKIIKQQTKAMTGRRKQVIK